MALAFWAGLIGLVSFVICGALGARIVLFCLAGFFSTAIFVAMWPPRIVLHFLERQFSVVFMRKDFCISLTIDDGPSENTEEILDVLKEYGVRATFFTISSHGRETTLRRALAEGHELANHTDTHAASISLTHKKLTTSMGACHEALVALGAKVTSFRPACGLFGPTVLRCARERDYKLVLGDCYPHDPQIPFVWWNLNYVLARATKGSIIILHDRPRTPELLRQLLPELLVRGHVFKRLGEK